MQEIDTIREHTPDDSKKSRGAEYGQPSRGVLQWRYIVVCLILAGFVLLAILPPLLNVSRFKRRIVTSISGSIGRPVHLDNVSLVLFPFPGFKLENFVVEEAAAFGAEPVIHANIVVATLRVSSLWRRKVEFSKISLQEPSINLVHIPSGAWNVESILLQAARIPAAPTAQTRAGSDPRFPYIEATGARVNVKYGNEKLPLSLTEADFALWLPRPQQWRVRLEGKPTRTDISASDTGVVSLEGMLGGAEHFDLIPIELLGEWKNAQLGEASRVITRRDAGLRGDLRLNVSVHGTVGTSLVKTSVQLRGVRRADFVPRQSLDLRAECQATSTDTFHAFHEIRCAWPPPVEPSQLALTADLADIRNAAAAPFELGTPGLSAATLLDWLRIASPRVPPDVTATGTLTGSVTRSPVAQYDNAQAHELKPDLSQSDGRHLERVEASLHTHGSGTNADMVLSGHLALESAALAGGPIGDTPIVLGDTTIATGELLKPATRLQKTARRIKVPATVGVPDGLFLMLPTSLALGGKDPAILEGRFDLSGYSLHLTGNVLTSRLIALASALPQFGDGLIANLPAPLISQARDLPVHIDLTSTRLWGGGQSWAKTAAKLNSPATMKQR